MPRGLTDKQAMVLKYLRGRSSAPTTGDVGALQPGRYPIGYDAALNTLKGLERKGRVKRIGGRPARWSETP